MDIKHLRYFVAMAEAGSLMKASERLHIAQPALSVHLANLETELGVKLVERSNRGIELTEEGHELYERATRLLAYHSEAILSLKKTRSKPAGQISLGVPSTMPELFAPHIMRAISQQLPDVRVYLMDASTAAIYDWLQTGKIDFAVLFNMPEDVGISLYPLFVEDYYLVGQFSDGGALDDTISFAKLPDYPLALPALVTSWRRILEDEAERHGKSLSVNFETESFSALRSLAISGDCYTILPYSGVLRDVMEGRVQARRIVGSNLRGLMSLAHLNNVEHGMAQRAALKVLNTTIRSVADDLGFKVGAASSPKICPGTLFSRHRSLSPVGTALRL